jgi:hypothetical protein
VTAAQIIEAFRHDKNWALRAFKVDPQGAARVVDENVPALVGESALIYSDFAQILLDHGLIHHYPLLFGCITDMQTGRREIVLKLNKLIDSSAPPELKEGFERAIETYIDLAVYPQQLKTRSQNGMIFGYRVQDGGNQTPFSFDGFNAGRLETSSEVALQRHLYAGVEGLTLGFTKFPQANLAILRRYIKLPEGDDKAIEYLKQRPQAVEWIK